MGNTELKPRRKDMRPHMKTLLSLVKSGDLEAVQNHLDTSGITPMTYKRMSQWRKSYFCYVFHYGLPCPVAMAAQTGQLEILNEFISRGFHPNELSECGVMPLTKSYPIHFAAYGGHVEIVRLLVEDHGVNVDKRDSVNNRPLDMALWNGHLPVVRFLVGHGIGVGAIKDHPAPLYMAAQKHHQDICEFLVSKGADVNVRGPRNTTLLIESVHLRNQEMARILLDLGANINEVNSVKESAFLLAVKFNQLDIVKLLISRGADPEECDMGKDTALHLAVFYNFYNIAHYLVVDLNVILDRTNLEGQSPFSLAMSSRYYSIAELLLNSGYNCSQDKDTSFAADDIPTWLRDLMCNPRTLQDLCRFQLRRLFGTRLWSDTRLLPLPQRLKDYLQQLPVNE